MNKVDLYEQATNRLEEAAHECGKTENVDINVLIKNCESCSECIAILLATEQMPVKVRALKELSISLNHHVEVLVAKKTQLLDGTVPTGTDDTAVAKDDNFHKSRRIAIDDTVVKKGNINFSDVAGLSEAKQALREAVIIPLQFPHLFTGNRKPWRRILLYGPPGTGKTRLAQAVSSEINSTFYSVSSSDLVSSWVGESEKLIRELFNDAKKRQGRSVIFIDEIDSICRKRSSREDEYTRRIKTELLKQNNKSEDYAKIYMGLINKVDMMEGIDSQCSGEQFFLLCATNCPWELDSAFLRRFQKRIYIPLPDRAARVIMMKMNIGSSATELTAEDWDTLGERTEGFSGSDLANCTSDAMFEPIRELEKATHWTLTKDGFIVPCSEKETSSVEASLTDLLPSEVQPRSITLDDFLKSLSRNSCTITKDDLVRFEQFTQSFGQKGQ